MHRFVFLLFQVPLSSQSKRIRQTVSGLSEAGVSKFILPILIWSVVYLFANGTFFSGDWKWILRHIISLPFSRQEGILWFMYVLMGLYLIAPVISPWLNRADKKTIRFYLLLWAVSLLYPWLKPFVDIEESAYGILYYSSGFLGFFVLGYYLKRFGVSIKLWACLLGLLVVVTLPVIYKLFVEKFEMGFGEIFWYLSIESPIMVVLWWCLLKHLSVRLEGIPVVKRFCVAFSNLSFGIYLSHFLILRYFVWKFGFVLDISNYVIQTIVVIMLTTVLSYFLSYIISKSPLGLQIISFKSK